MGTLLVLCFGVGLALLTVRLQVLTRMLTSEGRTFDGPALAEQDVWGWRVVGAVLGSHSAWRAAETAAEVGPSAAVLLYGPLSLSLILSGVTLLLVVVARLPLRRTPYALLGSAGAIGYAAAAAVFVGPIFARSLTA